MCIPIVDFLLCEGGTEKASDAAVCENLELGADPEKVAGAVSKILRQVAIGRAIIGTRFAEQIDPLQRHPDIARDFIGYARFEHAGRIGIAQASGRVADEGLIIFAPVLVDALQVETANLIIGLCRQHMLRQAKQICRWYQCFAVAHRSVGLNRPDRTQIAVLIFKV